MYKCKNHLKCLSLDAQNGVQLEIGRSFIHVPGYFYRLWDFRMEAALAEMTFDDTKDVEEDNDFVNDKGAVIH